MKYDYYDNVNINYPNLYNNLNNTNYNNQDNLYKPSEAYKLGNSFKNEYKGYKNYKVSLPNISTEREEMLYNLAQYAFITHDLNLYLDINPNDKIYLNKFIEYNNKYKELKNQYEKKYGPLCVNDMVNNQVFDWVTKEGMYV